MKKVIIGLALGLPLLSLTSCTENYSNGERVGYVAKFSRKGAIYKTWEGHLNMTQTGNNTADGWDFSIDGTNEPADVIETINHAVDSGFKVKLVYHQLYGKNWLGRRGETDYMVTKCIILKR